MLVSIFRRTKIEDKPEVVEITEVTRIVAPQID